MENGGIGFTEIEPSLQSVIDSHATIARATFARGGDDQTIKDTALLVFAGLGLAQVVFRNGEFVWVKTAKLKKLERTPKLADLSPFMNRDVQDSGEPVMADH